ncbi:pre-mRNA-splicing factor cwc-21 [Impatiens glandulifera]|uniref:pre-mRNA-splicing factor cwc-21 n=1 Tax=Impatiens glandulifera TaxID=253017 RepID=UPI001FB1935D|nr:pre-mRNA-splicing factor cwc-21 [Impatiens glandulifera]
MYNGIGLQTPRGSGTNGYIQSNRFFVKPKTSKVIVGNSGNGYEDGQGTGGISKKANTDILEHDRKRQIELKLVILEDKLTDQGYTSSEITEKLAEARRNLEDAAAEAGPISITDKKVSDTQTHQIAARKEKQLEALRSALKITGHETEGHRKVNNQDLNAMENNDDLLEDDILDKENTENFEDSKDDKDKKDASVRNMTGVLKGHKSRESGKEVDVDLSDSESDEKPATKKTGIRHKDTRGSDSEYERGTKVRHEPSATRGKGKRHDSSDSDGENEKDRSRQGKKLAKFEDEANRIGKKGRQQDHDDASSDEEEYEKSRKRHGRKRRHSSDDDSGRKNEKNTDRHYKKTKETDNLDSSDSEQQPRRKKEKTRRHDSDVSDAEDQRREKTVNNDVHDNKGRKNLENSNGGGYKKNNVEVDNTYRTKDGLSWAPRKDLVEKWNSSRRDAKVEEEKRGKRHKREEEEEVYNHSRWNAGGQDYSPEKEKSSHELRNVENSNKSSRLTTTKDEISWATRKDLDEKKHSSRRDEEGNKGGRRHRKVEEEEELHDHSNRWLAVDNAEDDKRHSSRRREAKDEEENGSRGGRKHKREEGEMHDDKDDDLGKRRRVEESGIKERERYNGDSNNKHDDGGRRQNRRHRD